MDSAASLVVFGVIGYFILRHCFHRTAFRWETLEWQQNVFESTGFGLLLFGAARLTAPWVHKVTEQFQAIVTLQHDVSSRIPYPYPGTIALGTAIGLAIAAIGNLLWSKDRALDLVVNNHGGRLRILLHDANRTDRPVMLSLQNRKMYVGAVAVPPPLRDPSQVVIFPTASGFRHSETLEVDWTTDYGNVYLEMMAAEERGEELATELKHFQLVIPLDQIVSATYFDRDIWDRHFDPSRRPSSRVQDDPASGKRVTGSQSVRPGEKLPP